jgi:hypothetical protein
VASKQLVVHLLQLDTSNFQNGGRPCMPIHVNSMKGTFQVENLQVMKLQVDKFQVDEFAVENFQVKNFQVKNVQVENF